MKKLMSLLVLMLPSLCFASERQISGSSLSLDHIYTCGDRYALFQRVKNNGREDVVFPDLPGHFFSIASFFVGKNGRVTFAPATAVLAYRPTRMLSLAPGQETLSRVDFSGFVPQVRDPSTKAILVLIRLKYQRGASGAPKFVAFYFTKPQASFGNKCPVVVTG
jgi:hypothetical protein